MTRDEFQARVLVQLGERRGQAHALRAVDTALDEVIAMLRPKLEREWSGGVVLDELYRWRGTKQ